MLRDELCAVTRVPTDLHDESGVNAERSEAASARGSPLLDLVQLAPLELHHNTVTLEIAHYTAATLLQHLGLSFSPVSKAASPRPASPSEALASPYLTTAPELA